jgi:hypothetical protein
MNIHKPLVGRPIGTDDAYLTKGITIDKYTENNKEKSIKANDAETDFVIRLDNPLFPNATVNLSFDWHYDLSKRSGREGVLDSTSFFLAYFYPRVAVFDDVDGWDRMGFDDLHEMYNDFNDYELNVTVPKNYLVWATGELQNAKDVLQPNFAAKWEASKKSDATINIVTQTDLDAKNVTIQKETNTWKWKASHITDMATCISNQYVWDAASVVVDKKTNRRSSVQAAYNSKSENFTKSTEYSHHSLDWFSNNWPGVPYPFPSSTVVQGFADMEYPMMANDNHQQDPNFQRFVAEHEIAHSWFPFYMGINEHKYGFMDEGWTTAFENLIGQADLGKEKANNMFKQFRINGWAKANNDESQIPIIIPGNVLNANAAAGDNQYGKPAAAYLAFKDMVGDDQFRKCLNEFMDRWNGKHPLPWDMFNSFNNIAAKDYNWFFNNWFFSTNYMDIALEKVTLTSTNVKLDIKNIGGFAIPTDVVVTYVDGTTETIHQTAAIWEKNQKQTSIIIPAKKKIQYIELDNGIWVDGDVSNNSWGIKPAAKNTNTFDLSKVKLEDLDAFVGIYAAPNIPIKITITRESNKLVAEVPGDEKITLDQVGTNKFEFKNGGLTMLFDAAKKTVELSQGGGTFKFTKE